MSHHGRISALVVTMFLSSACAGGDGSGILSSAPPVADWLYGAIELIPSDVRSQMTSEIGESQFSDLAFVLSVDGEELDQELVDSLANLEAAYGSFGAYLEAAKANPVAMDKASFALSLDQATSNPADLGVQQRAELSANLILLASLARTAPAADESAPELTLLGGFMSKCVVNQPRPVDLSSSVIRNSITNSAERAPNTPISYENYTDLGGSAWQKQKMDITPGQNGNPTTAVKTTTASLPSGETCVSEDAPEVAAYFDAQRAVHDPESIIRLAQGLTRTHGGEFKMPEAALTGQR